MWTEFPSRCLLGPPDLVRISRFPSLDPLVLVIAALVLASGTRSLLLMFLYTVAYRSFSYFQEALLPRAAINSSVAHAPSSTAEYHYYCTVPPGIEFGPFFIFLFFYVILMVSSYDSFILITNTIPSPSCRCNWRLLSTLTFVPAGPEGHSYSPFV